MGEARENDGATVVRAGWLIDGTGAEPQRDVTVTFEGGIITRVASGDQIPRDTTALDLGDYTVMPGLINAHTHTILPGDGTPFAEWMELPDELLLLQAHANALTALHSGVTTIRDCGGKGDLMFRLRDAIRAGIVPGPRFVLSGYPLTITGGHCRYFGGEVDGPEAMRHAARRLLKAGADFIKIMAAGGGTVGTYSQFPSFEVDEMRAAIAEAHKIGKLASCHCIATESITRALDAGTDHIEHCSFMAPDTMWRYDDVVAQRVAQSGVSVTATLQVMVDSMAIMQERYAQGIATPQEAEIVTKTPHRNEDSIANIRNLHALGVPIVAGNDAGWRYTGFDDFYEELQLLVRAGMTPLEAIHAATGRAAKACQLEGITGTIASGCAADLLAVRGDPVTDLGVLSAPAMVLQSGAVVVDRR
ncbi:MAG: amidohydrolase family protein [Chloroflexota bacterium]|nr:amidohydrolase family protein [Chloroflexota bacterium]